MALIKFDYRRQLLAILCVLVLILIMVLWQGYEILLNKEVRQKTMTTPATSAKPASSNNAITPNLQSVAADDGTEASINPSSNNQSEYLRLVKEYEMAQLQRLIAEDNEATAIAKRNAAEAAAQTTRLMGGTTGPVSNTNSYNAANTYELVFTGQQANGLWAATLKKQGETYDVVPGKVLPDGSQVISIDENGVMLSRENGANKQLITFYGEMQMTSTHPVVDSPEVVAVNVDRQNSLNVQQTLTQTSSTPQNIKLKPTPNPIVHTSSSSKVVEDINNTATHPVSRNNNHFVGVPAAKIVTSLPAPLVQTPKLDINKPLIGPSFLSKAITQLETNMLPNKPDKVKIVQAPVLASVSHANNAIANNTIVKVPLPAKSITTHRQPTKSRPQSTKQELLAVNPDHYTIQILSDHKLENVVNFEQTNQLYGKALYLRARAKKGNELFVLILGQYPTSNAAQHALQKLPLAIKREHPVIKRYAVIQNMLRQATLVTNEKKSLVKNDN